MAALEIRLATDFSEVPAGRFKDDGPDSGERFREELLVPKLNEAINQKVDLLIELDGVFSISSSFLEEAFGGLVRTRKFASEDLKLIKIKSSNRLLEWAEEDVKLYIADELKRQSKWFR